MKEDFPRVGLLAICLVLVLVQAATAWNVSQLTIDPSGAVTPGTPVVIRGLIDFIPLSDEIYESEHELQFSTDLENAEWTWSLILNGVAFPLADSRGKSRSFPWLILSHPNKNGTSSFRFTLRGDVLGVRNDKGASCGGQTQNESFLLIHEIDEHGNIFTGSIIERNGTVVPVLTCYPRSDVIKKDIQSLRTHIDEKKSDGYRHLFSRGKIPQRITKIRDSRCPSINTKSRSPE